MIDALGMIMTDRGKALQAKVQAGATLQYTRIALGSGRAEDIAPLNSLVDERLSVPVQPARVISNTEVQITGVLTNDGLASGFRVNEIGVFAQDPDDGEVLYAYTAAIDESSGGIIPAGGGATRIEQTINLIVAVSDADTVIISAVGTDAYVTWEFFRLDQERQDREFAEDQARQDAEIASLWSEKVQKGPPTLFQIPPQDGLSNYGTNDYYKAHDGRVYVRIGRLKTSGASFQNLVGAGEILGSLPVGFRPTGVCRARATGDSYPSTGIRHPVLVSVTADGQILATTGAVVDYSTIKLVYAEFSFLSESAQ